MILGILMTNKVKIAVLESQVERLLEKQKELTERVRANEKVVAAIGLLGSIAVAFIGAGYFAPKAEACSPPLDGSEFTCPSNDDIIVKIDGKEYDEEDITFYDTHKVTLYDTRLAHMGHDFPTTPTTGEWIEKMRDWESRKDRTPIDEMLNSALEDLEIDYGSDDPTKQEELLQLQSDGD